MSYANDFTFREISTMLVFKSTQYASCVPLSHTIFITHHHPFWENSLTFFFYFISSWIFYFINFFLCGHFQLTLFFFFIFRRWLMMRRWKQQQFCITYSLKWNGWLYSRKNSNWELQLGDRDKKSWIADFYHSLLCFYFSDDGWNWGNEWKKLKWILKKIFAKFLQFLC